jgi:LysM repeat protein/ABC-type branched-subunit amino acid transport system substrate-binding protein
MTKQKYIFLCFLFFACHVCLAQLKSTNIQTIDGKKYYIHKIDKGQSLYSISKTYSVSLEEIYRINPELKSGAKVDQEIKIPFATAPSVVPTAIPTASIFANAQQIDTGKYITYKILRSETVYSITRKFNITEKQLAIYNPGITPSSLKEGQTIIVGEKVKRKPAVVVKETKDNKAIITAKEIKPAVVFDSSFVKPPSKPKKSIYNIALILPFRFDQTLALDLNELIKTNTPFPPVPSYAVDFYLGFKRAVDSLKARDFEVNINLFESDDKDSVLPQQILNDPQFNASDMIFGPLYASGFKTIAKRAKELGIPIISPITTQNKILYNNIYVSKTNPSQFTLQERLADYCIDSLITTNSNIILMSLSDKDKKEQSFVNAFKKYYNDKQKFLGKSPGDTITLAKGIENLKTLYKPNVKNVVVALNSNQVFLADFITQLAIFANKKDITLCGWQSLTESDNIDQEYLNQLHYVFPHQFNLTNLNAYSHVIKSYIELQQTLPGEYYYIGFDIAYYYLKNLKESGPDFIHNLNNLPLETNYMRFNYTRPDNITGFDNRGVYIFRYNDYKLHKTGWK